MNIHEHFEGNFALRSAVNDGLARSLAMGEAVWIIYLSMA